MIRFDGIQSILESIYLSEELTTKLQGISIEVNPETLKFLSGKTVIINSRDYVLGTERGYANTIISRVSEGPGIIYVPYLPRVLPKIRWSGMIVGTREEALESYFYDSGYLYFPKIQGYFSESQDNLDFLGYIQYQIGYNFYEDSPFKDLDILKCRNGLVFD